MQAIDILLPEADVRLYTDFISASNYLARLKEEINWEEKEIILFGKKIKQPRWVAFYGDEHLAYKYSGQVMKATVWNDLLLEIKQEIFKSLGYTFNSCLLNYYRNGNDSMGWHQDNEKELGMNPIIASVSFGGQRVFKLKHLSNKDWKKDVLLTHGSLLIMAGATQHKYKHAVLKTKKFVEPRINLTFRNIITYI